MENCIKISSKDSEQITELLHYVRAHAKTDITKEELISFLINWGKRNQKEFLQKLQEEEKRKKEIKEDPFFHMPEIHLDEDSSESIDKAIYER